MEKTSLHWHQHYWKKWKKKVLQPKRVVGIEEKFNMPNSLTNVIDNKQA